MEGTIWFVFNYYLTVCFIMYYFLDTAFYNATQVGLRLDVPPHVFKLTIPLLLLPKYHDLQACVIILDEKCLSFFLRYVWVSTEAERWEGPLDLELQGL